MAKKIFGVYLAKLDAPNSEAHARLELPASPWELHDAMDKVQLQENEELYLEIDDYNCEKDTASLLEKNHKKAKFKNRVQGILGPLRNN